MLMKEPITWKTESMKAIIVLILLRPSRRVLSF